ncbi:uncharacterized protein [Montipora capricornis]|uniref:uncharacterized protein isoform X1 n=1 Tax=Montipora capricornis TaxID=246305 RepID=UPI0035F138CB
MIRTKLLTNNIALKRPQNMETSGLTTILKAFLTVLQVFLSDAVHQDAIEIKWDKGISRGGPNCGVSYGNFRLHKFSFLNITVISEALVEQTAQCSFACLETPECFSFNLGAFPDSNEKLLCKLLPSDKYNNSHEFLPNGLFHHYSIASPCSSWPCKNNRKCVTLYEISSYNCVCDERFTEKNIEEANFDCWRSSSKSSSRTWHHRGPVDAIDFQTNEDVILEGYRLWGVSDGSTIFNVTIRLYLGSTLLYEKTGPYPTNSSVKTFEVKFSHGISVYAGATYTAASKITTSLTTYAHSDGMESASCSGVNVTFALKSSRDTNGSSRSHGQIPALIFRS